MADWLSSLLAGLGSGAESLGASMSEREKRDAAAKQRAFELAMQQADKNAELGITDIAPQLPTTAAVNGIGNLQMPTPDPLTSFAKQISLGQGTGKNMVASPRFDVFNGTEAATGDMSDAATNADMSGAGMRGPVSAYGAPTMPRTKLGMEAGVPDVQAQLSAPPMTTGGVNEGESTVMQYDPLHPEAGLLRKRFNYQAGSDYAKKQAEESLPSNMLERQLKQGQIDDRKAQEQTRLAKAAINTRTEKYLQSSDYFQDVQAVTNSGSPAALARITANTAGSDHAEGVDKVIQSALTKRNIDPNSPAGIAAQIAIAKGKSESGTKGADSEYSKMPADRVLRVVQGVHNMAAVHPEMEKFEQAAKTNSALFDGADQFLKEYNSEIRSGPVGFMHNLFKSQAIVTLNKKNPALAQYIRNGLRYAQGENEYQSRTSDFRTQMADMLATISSNMSPASIDAVTAGRKGDAAAAVQMANQLRDVHKLPSDPAFGYFGVSSSKPSGGGSTKVLTPAQYKAAQTHYTDAEIQAQGYTIPGKTP